MHTAWATAKCIPGAAVSPVRFGYVGSLRRLRSIRAPVHAAVATMAASAFV